MRPAALPFVVLAALAAGGCTHNIGDTCNTNVDCSPLGNRFCDTAAPMGYCTIEGCDVRMNDQGQLIDSCQNVASESVCVRFFTLLACKPCDPANASASCAADERCLCDRADPYRAGVCLPQIATAYQCPTVDGGAPPVGAALPGHCAKESSERRWCMLKCSTDSDCRQYYHCISSGTNGAEPVPRGLAPIAGTDLGLTGVGDYSQKFCVYRGL